MTFDKVPTPGFEIQVRMTEKEARILEWLMGYDPKVIRERVTSQFEEDELAAVASSIRTGLHEPLRRIKEAQSILYSGGRRIP